MNPPSPLLPGESMSLFCDADSPRSHKKPVIAWLNPQEVKMNSHQGLFKGKATGQYNGQWTCVVTNEGKEHRVTVSVTVVGEFLCMCMYAFVLQWCTLFLNIPLFLFSSLFRPLPSSSTSSVYVNIYTSHCPLFHSQTRLLGSNQSQGHPGSSLGLHP